jgi:hypothetical protein
VLRRAARAVAAGLGAAACLGGCATLGVTTTATTAEATGPAVTTGTTATGGATATTGTATGTAMTGRTAGSRVGNQAASKLSQAQATHEYPSPPAATQTVTGDQPSPVTAIEAFADTYINWNAGNVAARLRALAAQSVGQARSAMALAAAGAAGDYELQRGGIANAGTVQGIAPLRDTVDQFVVVTLERTTATSTTAYAGLRPAWHLAIATVVGLPGGRWALSGWQPES